MRAQEKRDDFVKEQREKRAMKHLSEEERAATLKVKRFSGIMVLTVTLPG